MMRTASSPPLTTSPMAAARTAILRQQQELTVDFLAGLDEDQGEESSCKGVRRGDSMRQSKV
eukprot:scaffold765_cov66-Skeletonema_marinoi.AAC.1